MIDLMWLKSKVKEPQSLNRVLRWIMLPSTNKMRGGTGLGEGKDDEFSLTNDEF